MKRTSSYIVGIIGLAIGLIAPTASTQAATAAGPYYATPSWDQQLPASTRFIVLTNWIDANFPSGGAAVLDRETGLVWERSLSANTPNWFDAQFQCNKLKTGNRRGWRLPTLQDLASLVDPSLPLFTLSLPAGHPFTGVQANAYWTATTNADDTSLAWGMNFNGAAELRRAKSGSALVWCVRGGQGVDPQ